MYTTYYGFSAKPFQLSPDPRFFFGSSGHRRALAYLRYGLSQAEGFIVITGGIGTGKTTLVRNLFNELDSTGLVAAQLVTTQLDADDLLRMVVAAFGVPHEGLDKASLIKRFEDFLRSCAREGRRVLLVVDEAQNLPPRSLEELRMLSNFQVSETPLLQSFLLGQEEFRATLQAPGMEQLRQRVIASCHLNPLNEQETREYIEHRLRVVGWQNNPQFSDPAHQAIYRYTQGIPRRINFLCDRVLLYGFLEEIHEFEDANITSVNQELFQEADRGVEPPTTPSPGPLRAAPTQDTAEVSEAMNQRLAELEHVVASLAHRQQQDGAQQSQQLEQRLTELEPVVDSLREGFLELARVVDRSLNAKAD